MTVTKGAQISASEMPWGTHAAYVYADESEMTATVMPFLAAGLAGLERCIWVTALGRAEAEQLARSALPDYDESVRRGQLELLDVHEVYAGGDPETLTESWLVRVRDGLAAGFRGLRIVGDWCKGLPQPGTALIDYERRIGEVVRAHHVRALCGYRLTDSSQLAQASETHDWLLASGAVLHPAKPTGASCAELAVALGMASHELLMPLQILSIGMETGLVARDAAARERIRRAVRSLARIASDLQEVALLGKGGIELSPTETDLGALCRRVVAEFGELYPARRIVIAAVEPVRGVWDELRLEQLVANLVANAIRYGKDPIRIVDRVEGNEAVLEVIDAGAPRSPGTLAPLSPLSGLGGRDELGLGLLVVREIARAHGGEVEAASLDGRLSLVRVRLPLQSSCGIKS